VRNPLLWTSKPFYSTFFCPSRIVWGGFKQTKQI